MVPASQTEGTHNDPEQHDECTAHRIDRRCSIPFNQMNPVLHSILVAIAEETRHPIEVVAAVFEQTRSYDATLTRLNEMTRDRVWRDENLDLMSDIWL